MCIEQHTIIIKLKDFTEDKDEPGYDIEMLVDGKNTMGGGDRQIFTLTDHEIKAPIPKEIALKRAKKRIEELLTKIKSLGEE